MLRINWRSLTIFFCVFSIALFAVPTFAQRRFRGGNQDPFRFRFVGPIVGNRIASVAGVPGDPNVYYAGAASGGVWKTTDGGNRWEPIFDKEPAGGHRRAGGGALRSQHRVGRHRRSVGHS